MTTIQEIKMHVDYACGLLNQKVVVHYNGQEYVFDKMLTGEDIRRTKEVLRDVMGELDSLETRVKLADHMIGEMVEEE